MNREPLVSVIIPAYNRQDYLEATLQSVFAQTYSPFEIIVVDDGSADATAEIAQAYPVRYVYQTHAGLGTALNRGVQEATGDLFSFLDSDDLWTETKLARQLELYRNQPGLDAVFGNVVQFQIDPLTKTEIVSAPMEGYFKGTMLITRAAFFRVGQFDTQWLVGDFIDWWLRASELGIRSAMLSEVVLKRRIHDSNTGLSERANYKAYVHILKKSLDRRKAQQP